MVDEAVLPEPKKALVELLAASLVRTVHPIYTEGDTCRIMPGGSLVQVSQDAVVYFVVRGVRREVFTHCFLLNRA
jgi:hypothetical protein